MIICSLKFTHDGTVALLDNGKLIFSYEMEKINNNNRFSSLDTFYNKNSLEKILVENGYSFDQVDRFVVDGWGKHGSREMDRNDYPAYKTVISHSGSEKFQINHHRYGLLIEDENILNRKLFYGNESDDFAYSSYMHVAGHVMSAYCTSPFAKRNESSFILVWDGAMFPQVFYFNAEFKTIENLGILFYLLGFTYNAFATNYKPFNKCSVEDLSVAGKVMAFIALGNCNKIALKYFKDCYYKLIRGINPEAINHSKYLTKLTEELMAEIVVYGELNDIEGPDMLATYHVFLQELILKGLQKKVDEKPNYPKNLCFVGGSALNIKWNSQIRNAKIFKEMWVPPFPNDSGSAIGAACCEMFVETGKLVLDWDVFRGPLLKSDLEYETDTAWEFQDCSLKDLGKVLYSTNKPVVFLNERAELGPRSLGNRSILAAPSKLEMKSILNDAKNREEFRPVAPICLEEEAEQIFVPGTPDPYMLYDHLVKDEWKERIPAICHLDGTARLQTINKQENPAIYRVLQEYRALSGIPVLCNTSANFNGKGFFPDVSSAMRWGKVALIWSNGKLHFKNSIAKEIRSCLNLFQRVS